MSNTKELIECPFCGEGDFDKIGLKIHLIVYCEKYSNTPMEDPPKNDDGDYIDSRDPRVACELKYIGGPTRGGGRGRR